MAHGKSKRRWTSRALLLAAAIAAMASYGYLAPTLTARSVTQYTPYTVENRDIASAMSLGGTVSILHSEAVSFSESATVREVYVSSSQAVSKGDKLLQMEDGTVLTAGIDGLVNQLRASPGRWAMANMTLVQICDLTHMQISMSVDEYDISSIRVGQPCTVYILPLGLTFDTEIAHINRVSASAGTMAYYTVGVELTVPETVLPGMQASVTIPLSQALDVPALPVEALSFEDGQPCVYLDGGGDGYALQAVELGLNDGMYVQVLQGLSAGDTVYSAQTVELAGEGFDLTALYKKLFGEKVVIASGERSRGAGRGASDGSAGQDAAPTSGGAQAGGPDGSAGQDAAPTSGGAQAGGPDGSAGQNEAPIPGGAQAGGPDGSAGQNEAPISSGAQAGGPDGSAGQNEAPISGGAQAGGPPAEAAVTTISADAPGQATEGASTAQGPQPERDGSADQEGE